MSKAGTKKQTLKNTDFRFSDQHLEEFISADMNVLLIGESGIGKTARVLAAIDRLGLRYSYFSTPTTDPHVHFLGIPRAKDVEGYFEMLRPRDLVEKNPEVIVLDEINRAPKKISNALMELIQFKSINGVKFPALKCVIAMMNPIDSEEHQYNVEYLDIATLDRFEAQIQCPYDIDTIYFKNKYAKIGEICANWWSGLDASQKNAITPRRVEYVCKAHMKQLDLRAIIPLAANPSSLIDQLKNVEYVMDLDEIVDSNNIKQAKDICSDQLKFEKFYNRLIESTKLIEYFIEFFPEEQISQNLLTNTNILNFEKVLDKPNIFSVAENILEVHEDNEDNLNDSQKERLELIKQKLSDSYSQKVVNLNNFTVSSSTIKNNIDGEMLAKYVCAEVDKTEFSKNKALAHLLKMSEFNEWDNLAKKDAEMTEGYLLAFYESPTDLSKKITFTTEFYQLLDDDIYKDKAKFKDVMKHVEEACKSVVDGATKMSEKPRERPKLIASLNKLIHICRRFMKEEDIISNYSNIIKVGLAHKLFIYEII